MIGRYKRMKTHARPVGALGKILDSYIFHMAHGYLHHCTAHHGRTTEEIDLPLAISTKSEHK